MKLENIRTIFFDYDGTLHDSTYLYVPAFKKAYDFLVKEGYAKKKNWKIEEITQWIGYNPAIMWKEFMPSLSEDLRNYCSNIITEEMSSLIELGHPKLYEGSTEVLGYLKSKGYTLVLLSNCKKTYLDGHSKFFSLENYFDRLICSQEFNYLPKYEILSSIKSDYSGEMVLVGDRKQDIESGLKNNMFTIGCSYGFGLEEDLIEANIRINDIRELMNLF